MRDNLRWIRGLKITFIFILCFLVINKPSYAEGAMEQRVLFLSSYHYNFDSVPKQIQGVNDVLASNNIEFDVE